jgi:GT2 family glycosyltransferase
MSEHLLVFHEGKRERIKFSLISPTFRRPDEVAEFLDSLQNQSYTDFEVILADGTPHTSLADIARKHRGNLDLTFLYESGLPVSAARNAAAAVARGHYFVFLDSDCLIPPDYLNIVSEQLLLEELHLFGGPDAAHPSFTPVQRAISYSMTGLLTTGGIRGKKTRLGVFHPRGFNMGVQRDWFQSVGGYSTLKCGEDIELSMRLIAAGAKSALIPKAKVFHKRRTDFNAFYRQVYRFGAARIHLHLAHKGQLNPTHVFPAAFLLFHLALIPALFLPKVLLFMLLMSGTYSILLLLHASIQERSLFVGLLSVRAAYTQLMGYGSGFLHNAWVVYVRNRPEGLDL